MKSCKSHEKNETKNIKLWAFSFSSINLAFWFVMLCFFMCFARFQILICELQSIWSKLLALSLLYVKKLTDSDFQGGFLWRWDKNWKNFWDLSTFFLAHMDIHRLRECHICGKVFARKQNADIHLIGIKLMYRALGPSWKKILTITQWSNLKISFGICWGYRISANSFGGNYFFLKVENVEIFI